MKLAIDSLHVAPEKQLTKLEKLTINPSARVTLQEAPFTSIIFQLLDKDSLFYVAACILLASFANF